MKQDEIKEIQARCQREPTFFSENVLGINTLWKKQEEILSSVRDNPTTCAPSGHSTGKTFVSAVCLLWFLYSFKDSIVLSTSSSWLQLERVLWSTVKKLHQNSKIPLGGEMLSTSLKLDYGWHALGVSTDSPENFSGYHSKNILILVDEGSSLEKPIFQAIQGCLAGGGNSRLLAIGNPLQPSGTFYDLSKDSSVNTINISSWEAAAVEENLGLASKAWCEDRLREWGEDSPLYQSRVLGFFPSEGTDVIFPFSMIQQAISNTIQKNEANTTLVGIDPARYGDDSSVILTMRGGVMLDGIAIQKKSIMETCGYAIDKKKKYNADAFVVDSCGLGSGAVDRLREMGHKVYAVNFAESPTQKNKDVYENSRAEAYFFLKEDLEHSRLQIKNCPLVSELPNIKYAFTSSGKLKIESKESMKKRGLRSPDWSDALCITNYIRRKYGEFTWCIEDYDIGYNRNFVPPYNDSADAMWESEFGDASDISDFDLF